MLAYILAVLVGMGSVGLYLAAFFFPEIHRKQDFIWSGVGFLYALCLWIYAHQMTGGILVGQTANVALLGWFAWQILKLRRQLVPVSQQTPIPDMTKLQTQLGLNRGSLSAQADALRTRTRTERAAMPKAVKPTPKTPASAQPTTPAPPSTPRRPGRENVVPASESTPLAQVTVPPATEKTDVESAVPPIDRETSQPDPNPPTQDIDVTSPGEEQAWIKLEVMPSPAPVTKPLGTAVKPPNPTESRRQTPPPTAIIPASGSTNSPPDSIDTTAKTNPDLQG
jgi:hypothetical protein